MSSGFVISDRKLQCGHGPKTVENLGIPIRRHAEITTLQCGHGPKTVENHAGLWRHGCRHKSFNAATARRPWRTVCGRRPSLRSKRLQCGHGPKTVENDRAHRRLGLQGGEASMRPRPEDRGERVALFVNVLQLATPASMRPRPEDRGEHLGLGLNRFVARPSFNAATARRPWRTDSAILTSSAAISLQCGHGPKTVENLRLEGAQRPSPVASMRPRPEDRGERDVDCGTDGLGIASMRPRPEDRGEHARRPTWTTTPGFNAATARRPWRTSTKTLGTTGTSCFNAATARRPWRTQPQAPAPTPPELQCGHGPKTVENGRCRRPHGGPSLRFNAATARRPWRTRKSSSPRKRRWLQCGHGPKTVENHI